MVVEKVNTALFLLMNPTAQSFLFTKKKVRNVKKIQNANHIFAKEENALQEKMENSVINSLPVDNSQPVMITNAFLY